MLAGATDNRGSTNETVSRPHAERLIVNFRLDHDDLINHVARGEASLAPPDTVRPLAKVSGNGANFYDEGPVFDAARWVQQIKLSRSGSYTTPVIRWSAGSRRGLEGGYLQLDWDNDGKGYRIYSFTASPAV
jgi:hypothetical protein